MTTTMADLDLEPSGSGSDAAAAAAAEDEEEGQAPHHQSIFLDPTKVSGHATELGAENQVTEVGGQKENANETSGAQSKEIEKQDNVSAQETNHSSNNGKLENGSHSNGVHEISSSSETVTIADGLKLITTIRDARHILPNWSGSVDVSSGSTTASEVHEIEVEKDEIVTKGEVKVEEYDLEKILDEQETHDLYCPNCKSCITRRVILKKRKRTVRPDARKETPKRPQLVEPSANVPRQTVDEHSPEVFRCLLCFTFFIPTGCNFNIFRIFERRDINQQVQVQHSSASQQTSENCGSWLLSCFQTADSPKPSNNADSLEEPLLSDSQRTDPLTSVEDNTPAEQSKKPSPAGSQTTTATNEVKQSFSQFHASSTVVTGSTKIESVHVVNVQQYGAHQEQIPLSQPAGDTKTDTSLGHKEEFTQIEAGNVIAVQRNGASQEQIPLSQASGDTATDSMHLDILEGITAPSDNSPFFSQPFFEPVLPIKVLPGLDSQMVEKPISVIRQPAEPEAPPHTVLAVPEAEIPVPASSAPRDEWDILKAIVYGGLVESITSLSVVSAAAASGAKTLDLFILGIANLIGGLPVIYHNIADLRNTGDVAESSEQVGHYWLELGRRSKYQLHMVIAILSYILFGLLPPVIYGLSFRTSDNRENKMLVVAAVSLLCIALLAIGKAHVKRPRTYFTTLLYYLSIGFSSSGLSYVAGVLITKLLAHFGIIDQGGASAPAPPGLSFPEAAAWASY
ncbi:membrane protein of ER body-like protein [Miscanthus floridulus]|uniref:membrane protein of ER body-like protein n=1 Tax=Miscanthus floridulus TaxID=154761 RepID=UPI0034593D09